MLSIITPVFNGEKFIEFCIKNVIEQDCSDLEHIIVDGGSTDNTAAIIKQYAEQYPHIRWVSEKDRGQSDAMNKGIRMAKGEIIGILNNDDFYAPSVLNRVFEIFQTLPEPSFVVGNCNVLGEDDRIVKVNRPKHLKLLDLVSRIHPFPVNPSAYFYHRSLHNKIGFYDIEDQYMMDIDFILKAVQNAHVHYVNETWGNFRHIQGTKTVTHNKSLEYKRKSKMLLRKYYVNLNRLQRLQAWTGVEIISRIIYYFNYPHILTSSIKKKFREITKLARKFGSKVRQ
ncbi:MAG: hypothetical protein Kow00121_23590 [Elainellaceae cyanobacterium]